MTHLGLTGGMVEGRKRETKIRGKERESFRERSSTFSLIFQAIGPAVYEGSRRKVHPSGKSFTSGLESESFDKLQEVGFFSYLV